MLFSVWKVLLDFWFKIPTSFLCMTPSYPFFCKSFLISTPCSFKYFSKILFFIFSSLYKLLYNSSWLFSIRFSITFEFIIFAEVKKSEFIIFVTLLLFAWIIFWYLLLWSSYRLLYSFKSFCRFFILLILSLLISNEPSCNFFIFKYLSFDIFRFFWISFFNKKFSFCNELIWLVKSSHFCLRTFTKVCWLRYSFFISFKLLFSWIILSEFARVFKYNSRSFSISFL